MSVTRELGLELHKRLRKSHPDSLLGSQNLNPLAYRSSNGGFTSDNVGSDNSPGDLRLHPYAHATLWK